MSNEPLLCSALLQLLVILYVVYTEEKTWANAARAFFFVKYAKNFSSNCPELIENTEKCPPGDIPGN